MRRRLSQPLLWLLVLSAFGALGFVLLASCFMVYDDEGYILLSVRSFCEGHPLYTEVYSQYGPLFYLGYRALNAATGLVFNSETGRLLTLAYWLGTALISGLIVQMLTKRLVAGLSATALTFAYLVYNIREPFHPGSLVALLSVIAAGLGARLLLKEKHRQFAWSIAVIATAMALIKINVGLFLGAALGGWMLINSRWPSRPAAWLRAPAWMVALFATAAVLLLLNSKLDEAWVLRVGVIFICGMFALTARLSLARADLHGLADWKVAALATGGVVGSVTLMTWLLGTSLADLLDAVLLGPLRHPGVYSFPPNIPPSALPCAVAMLVLLLLACRAKLKPLWLDLITVAQIATGLWFFFFTKDAYPSPIWIRITYAYGPSLVALLVFATNDEQASPAFRARLWVGWVFLWQTLHVYPVAGSQLAWGTFLFIPVVIVGWFAAFERLRLRFRLIMWPAVAIPLLAAGLATANLIYYGQNWWRSSTRLDLPGARWLRIQPDLADSLQIMQRNLVRHADTVFSFPGMFSFNLWTDRPAPTAANATHWFNLLKPDQQNSILEKLRGDPRACVVMQRYHLHYLYSAGFIPDSPLKNTLLGDFTPAVRIGDYDLWVKRGRRIDAIDTFRLDAGFARAWLHAPVRPIAKVALIPPDAAAIELSWTLTPPDASAPATAPQAALARLDARVPGPYVGAAQIYLYDAQGEVLGRLLQNVTPNDAALLLPSRPSP
jgi:hypothetical protein